MLIERAVHEVLDYFAVFSYPPTEDELYRFLSIRVSKDDFQQTVYSMVRNGSILCTGADRPRYARRGDMFLFEQIKQKELIAKQKISSITRYISILNSLSWIQFVAITGSLSMGFGRDYDDIDLFIVSAPGRMWSARLCSNLIAIALGRKRSRTAERAPDAICLNLFFDQKHLKIPEDKKNEYIAHELLQMKPILDKNGVYRDLLKENRWIFDLFPNAEEEFLRLKKTSQRAHNPILFGTLFERFAKSAQLSLIKRHMTHERITDNQLWFFPTDFQNELERKVRIRTHNLRDFSSARQKNRV